ncbi:MAG: prolyl-tRNA synthetase associated domain-containing protein [Eubacteriales bacterium]
MKNAVLALLDELIIPYEYLEHPPAMTMEDLADMDEKTDAVYMKNLFLRNGSGKQHYLVVVCGDKRVDLKALAGEIGSSRLSFASDERLLKHLGLKPGQVGPFGLMNDKEKAVMTILDKDMVGCLRISFHPNDNAATVIISYDDLQKYLNHVGAAVRTVSIPEGAL